MESEEEIIKGLSVGMLNKIRFRYNEYKPFGWKNIDTSILMQLLKEEVVEMENAHGKNIATEAIDIANYALFIWYLNKG